MRPESTASTTSNTNTGIKLAQRRQLDGIGPPVQASPRAG